VYQVLRCNIVHENISAVRRSKRVLDAKKIRDLLSSLYANEVQNVMMGWA
jgi:hypothetical protein